MGCFFHAVAMKKEFIKFIILTCYVICTFLYDKKNACMPGNLGLLNCKFLLIAFFYGDRPAVLQYFPVIPGSSHFAWTCLKGHLHNTGLIGLSEVCQLNSTRLFIRWYFCAGKFMLPDSTVHRILKTISYCCYWGDPVTTNCRKLEVCWAIFVMQFNEHTA